MNKIDHNFFWELWVYLFQKSPLADYKVKPELINQFLLAKEITPKDIGGAISKLISWCKQCDFLPAGFEVEFDLRYSREPVEDTVEILAQIAVGMIDKEYKSLDDINSLWLYVLIEKMIIFLKEVVEAGQLTGEIDNKFKDEIMNPRCALRKMIGLKIIK